MRTGARVLIALVFLVTGVLVLMRIMPPASLTDTTGNPYADTVAALFDASLPDASGRRQPLAQWRGKVIVVNFWASWCPPCLEEMPELSALQDRYRDQGLVIVGISTDDVVKLQQFSRATSVDYPLLAGDFDAMRLAASLGNDKEVLPYTVVLRADGSLAASHFGRLDMQALEQALPPLLAGPG